MTSEMDVLSLNLVPANIGVVRFRAERLERNQTSKCQQANGDVSEQRAARRVGVVISGGSRDGGCSSSGVEVDQLLNELTSIATEWKSLRTAVSCSCDMPFEQHNQKVFDFSCLKLCYNCAIKTF